MAMGLYQPLTGIIPQAVSALKQEFNRTIPANVCDCGYEFTLYYRYSEGVLINHCDVDINEAQTDQRIFPHGWDLRIKNYLLRYITYWQICTTTQLRLGFSHPKFTVALPLRRFLCQLWVMKCRMSPPNVVVSMPSQLFTGSFFAAVANGKIYIGKIDTDGKSWKPDSGCENEDGSHVPVSQPIIINAAGYPVYNGLVTWL